MPIHYQADFRLSLIKGQAYRIDPHESKLKCHQFSLEDPTNLFPTSVKLLPGKSIAEPWLYGPAMNLLTRSIIYPCTDFRCSLPCPCLLCAKIHSKCRVPSSKPCSCPDCAQHFENHREFHGTFHFGCKFCFQLVQKFPHFNFFFLDTEDKGMPPRFVHPDYKIGIEFLRNWKMAQKGIALGLGECWCRVCNLLCWSISSLRSHIESCHSSSKIFRHSNKSTGIATPTGEYNCHQSLQFTRQPRA